MLQNLCKFVELVDAWEAKNAQAVAKFHIVQENVKLWTGKFDTKSNVKIQILNIPTGKMKKFCPVSFSLNMKLSYKVMTKLCPIVTMKIRKRKLMNKKNW